MRTAARGCGGSGVSLCVCSGVLVGGIRSRQGRGDVRKAYPYKLLLLRVLLCCCCRCCCVVSCVAAFLMVINAIVIVIKLLSG